MGKTSEVDVSEDGQGMQIEVPYGDAPVLQRSGIVASRENALPSGGVSPPPVHPHCFLPYIKSQYFLELLMCLVYALLAVFLPPYVPLNQRPIPYQTISTGDIILNLELNHAYKQETISYEQAVLIVFVIFLIQVVLGFFIKRDPLEFHKIFCLYAVALGSTLIITEVMKRYIGQLRPNFYEYCGFQTETLACTNSAKKQDWRMSFPSGHSSTIFCGCVLLVRYAWSCITNTCTDPFKRRCWLMVALSPLLVAYFVAASRVYDNYHFVGDVIGGSVIGTANALVFHCFWFSETSPIYQPISP